MPRLFGTAGDEVDLGSPSKLDDLFTTGQTMIVAELRRNAGGAMVIAQKGGGVTSGTGWSLYINDVTATPGFVHLIVERATAFTLVRSDVNVVPNAHAVVGAAWDSTQASGDAGVLFFGGALQTPGTDIGATVGQAGSGAYGADAATNLTIGNVSAGGDSPFKGDLGWVVILHKTGSTPYTLDEFRRVQAGILALKAAREAGAALTRGLAMINGVGGAVLIQETVAVPVDHSASPVTATLTGTSAGTEELNHHTPTVFEDDLEPEHPGGGTDQTLYILTSEFARNSFITTATGFRVWARYTGPFLSDDRVPQIGYLINGVYTGTIKVSASATPGYFSGAVGGLSASSKTITLINGMRISTDGVRPFSGTYLTHVWFNAAATEQTPATRSNPLVALVDSTLEGFYVTNTAQEGAVQKLRLNLPSLYDGIIMYGAGALSLFAVGPDATARQVIADLLVAPSPRAILIHLGGNDWLNNYWNGLSNYQAALEDLLTKLKVAFAGHIYVDGIFTPPTGSEYLNPNAIGETIADLRTAISAACTAAGSRVTYLDLTSVISAANFDVDLKHPNIAGHDELYQFFLTELNRGFGESLLTLPQLSIEASGAVLVEANAAPSLSALSVAASGTLGAGVVSGEAILGLSSLSLSATGTVSIQGITALSIPALQVTATSSVLIGAETSLDLPSLTETSAGSVLIEAEASNILPALQFFATGEDATATGEATLALPALSATITGVVSIVGDAALMFPALEVQGIAQGPSTLMPPYYTVYFYRRVT